jgi:anaerobic magnesium-protoporphyrin IX monomethyl ester cyclase
MRFQKVLLVSPPSPSFFGGLRVPAGIGHIAQVLYDNSIEYDYVDMRIGYSLRYLKKKALTFKPDLIGFSMISLGYKTGYKIISEMKHLLPDTKIVTGGHHVTILREKVLHECNGIDFGVVFDGEETILELCRSDIPYENIKGLIFRKDGRTVFTGDRPLVQNLDKYAFPKYINFNMKEYSKQIPIHFSRGCVYQCTFCPNKLLGRKYRTYSPKYFVDEIKYWYDKGIRQFAIDDDNFALEKDKVYEVCDEIERRNLKGLFIRCSNGFRADSVDRPLLERMKEIGIREVSFGVDGGNNKMLQLLKKGETIETIERAIKDACDVGFDVKLFIITGTPHETAADIEDSIRLVRKYPVARVDFNNPIPYPGTEMFDYVKEHNLFVIPPEDYLNNVSDEEPIPVFETPELSKEERVKILKRCRKVEKEITKNTAVRMYGNNPVSRFLITYFFSVTLFEKLFFNNLFFRKIFEFIRYKKLVENR